MPNDEHPQPSERLRFRLWTADDLPLARALWGDPAVTRWIGGAFDDETVKRMLEEQLGYFAAHGAQYFPLFRRDDHAFVGCAGLRPHASSETPLELGFQLLPAHWKQGLALEAAAAVIVHARATLRAPALFAGHHPDNAASRRVLLALGFVHTHDELYPPTGALHPSYRLALC